MQLNVDYLSVSVNCSENLKEIYMAELAGMGYEGFLETPQGFEAYITSSGFNREELDKLLYHYQPEGSRIELNTITPRNWNAEWENSFHPVMIGGICRIRAPFHARQSGAEYDIVISPKMSFGTGHHETTGLMIGQMLEMDFAGKSVLDLGSGTGILAILAEMMGADKVLSVDHEEWAFRNCQENISLNNCSRITAVFGDADSVRSGKYDIILANINRNIIIGYMDFFKRFLSPGGTLLLSGFYLSDLEAIEQACMVRGLSLQTRPEKNKWVSLNFLHNSEK